jgi:diadenosine tetraphosphate (Ap4A) HIT family hydrolase
MRHLPKQEALAALEAATSGSCVMCELASGQRDAALQIHHDETATVLLDRFAAAPGHLLIVLATHVEHVAQLPIEAYLHTQQLAWRACRALEATLSPRRTYVASFGSSAPLPTSFPHFHLHVVPISEDGESARPAKVFSWGEGVWVFESDEEAAALAARFRAAWRSA